MLKFLAILFIGFWIIRSVFKFFFNPFIQGASQQNQRQTQSRQHARPKDGNVDVNFAPKKSKEKSTQNYKGGDYVDFEEVD